MYNQHFIELFKILAIRFDDVCMITFLKSYCSWISIVWWLLLIAISLFGWVQRPKTTWPNLAHHMSPTILWRLYQIRDLLWYTQYVCFALDRVLKKSLSRHSWVQLLPWSSHFSYEYVNSEIGQLYMNFLQKTFNLRRAFMPND